MSGLPAFPDLSYDLCDGYTKGNVAVHDSDTNLDLGDLPVKFPSYETLP